jgi:hypothetical protein
MNEKAMIVEDQEETLVKQALSILRNQNRLQIEKNNGWGIKDMYESFTYEGY